MADMLGDVMAALCQVARDYSRARTLENVAAAENWRKVFGLVLDARVAPVGRGAALAAFRAERCPDVDRAYVDELAPPPPGTVSLSSATLRWLVDTSGLDAVAELGAPDIAWDRYARAAEPKPGQAAFEHAMAGAGAREALAWAAIGGDGRRDVPLGPLRRLIAAAESGLSRGHPARIP